MLGQTDCEYVAETTVLLVESSSADARLIEGALSQTRGAMEVRHGLFTVRRVDRLAAALDLLAGEDVGVVLLDLQLPDAEAFEAIAKLRAAARHVPVVVLAGHEDDGLALAAIRQGAQEYVAKDRFDGRVLRRAIRHAMQRQRSEVELLRHAREVEAARAHIEQQAAELKARAEQLDRINRELDDFTYIASHDLKEPLRGISAYCQILLEDYADKLDHRGQRRLDTLVRLCNRLEILIGDLLTYCRLGGIRPADERIELDEVAEELLETLRPSIDRRNAAVHVAGPLPTVSGDATLIRIVLSNLITNGLKFNDSPRPCVEIGSLPGDPSTLWVRDNGIGIERKHHEEIFTIFRRLHGRKKYEGTGAGLTIVRKIVEAHGGRIWLESEPGSGTTFFLTLALPEQEQLAEAPPEKPAVRSPHWVEHSLERTPQRQPDLR